jgi:hypothetical protein
LEYGTFFGGSGWDGAKKLQVLEDGTIYILGVTESVDLPADPGAYTSSRQNDRTDRDLVVIRLDSTLSAEFNCTYLGGSKNESWPTTGLDWACDLFVEPSGNVFVASTTVSSDFPITAGAIFSTARGVREGVVAKLDRNLTRLLNSTYIGGTSTDIIESVVVDKEGSVYLTGTTSSTNFPITPDALGTSNGGKYDTFLTIMNNNLTTLEYSTYIGGNEDDGGRSVGFRPQDDKVYIVGWTDTSQGLNVTSGAVDSVLRGSHDPFIWVLNLTENNITYASYLCGGSTYDTTFHPQSVAIDQIGPDPMRTTRAPFQPYRHSRCGWRTPELDRTGVQWRPTPRVQGLQARTIVPRLLVPVPIPRSPDG